MAAGRDSIYSATYSSIPVYEFKVAGENVMRRRSDDWINATHILKVAGLDKASRTRILEREVQRGVHQKVQGGYGKYQGTWIPLHEGRALAIQHNALDRLAPILDFVPGDRSPPPAPKHATAAGRSRIRRTVPPRVLLDETSFGSFQNNPSLGPSFDQFSVSQSFDDAGSMAQSMESSSIMADEDMVQMSQQSSQPKKRKRTAMNEMVISAMEHDHTVYGDQLLDYFMTVGDVPAASGISPPTPPPNFQPNRAIDDQGNTALHWACSMGDIGIVKDLIDRGANIAAPSNHDETPLVRAVLFTNNYEKSTMPELADLLQPTITSRDWFGATIFNHLAATTKSKGKWKSARYYCQILLDKLDQFLSHDEIVELLCSRDKDGDTAALAAARNGCTRLASKLLSRCPKAGELENNVGETANEMMCKNSRRPQEAPAPASSVPPQSVHDGGDVDGVRPDNDNVHGYTGQMQTPSVTGVGAETTSTLLAGIGAIVEDATRKLALIYGETKWPSAGNSDLADPRGLYEHVETDREQIRKQTAALASREDESERFDERLARFGQVREQYERVLEQVQFFELGRKLRAAGCQRSSHQPDVKTEPQSSNGSTPANDPSALALLLPTIRALAAAQQLRITHLRALVHQRADADGAGAASTRRLAAHRKLVALATNLPENELDAVSGELAEALEFDREHEQETGNRSHGVDGVGVEVGEGERTPVVGGGGGGGSVGRGAAGVDGEPNNVADSMGSGTQDADTDDADTEVETEVGEVGADGSSRVSASQNGGISRSGAGSGAGSGTGTQELTAMMMATPTTAAMI